MGVFDNGAKKLIFRPCQRAFESIAVEGLRHLSAKGLPG